MSFFFLFRERDFITIAFRYILSSSTFNWIFLILNQFYKTLKNILAIPYLLSPLKILPRNRIYVGDNKSHVYWYLLTCNTNSLQDYLNIHSLKLSQFNYHNINYFKNTFCKSNLFISKILRIYTIPFNRFECKYLNFISNCNSINLRGSFLYCYSC